MLDNNLKSALQGYLQNLKTPVELHVASDSSEKGQELTALVNDIAGLSSMIVVKAAQNATRVPSMQVRSTAKNTNITFAGVPMGHEFTSLVLAHLHGRYTRCIGSCFQLHHR